MLMPSKTAASFHGDEISWQAGQVSAGELMGQDLNTEGTLHISSVRLMISFSEAEW